MMKTAPAFLPYLLIGLMVLTSCWALFLLDKDTHGLGDLFKTGNLVALAIYFIPSYILCLALFWSFKARNIRNGFALSLALGIPAGLALVMVLLTLWMSRF